MKLGEKEISVKNLQLICDTLHISLRNFFNVPTDQDREQMHLMRQIARLTDERK